MALLTHAQVACFREQGFVTAPGAVTATQLDALREDFARWVELSREHDAPFGEMLDGRPRFDVEPGHSREAPALRRVASPTELSGNYLAVLTDSPMLEMIAQLIGPDLRFHHSKLNSKLPGTATRVEWHQDFTFDPHTNDDMVTALVFLDEVTDDNGPLKVVPGSHRGPLLSLRQQGRFTGAVDAATAVALERDAVPATGPAGAACLMHVRTAHASSPNRSSRARTLFIAGIAAADALPLAPNAVPSIHEGRLLRGREPNRIRSVAFEMEMPEVPEGASFFHQQASGRPGAGRG